METLSSILRDLQQGMWMISLDLKDAYLHIPIIPQHRKFLRFALRDHQGILRIIPMGSPPIRFGHRSQGIYQAFNPYSGLLASEEYGYVPVHRQQLPRSHLQGFGHSDSRRKCVSSSSARICDQPSKVFPYPLPGDDTPRLLDGHPQWPSLDKVQEINQVSADLLADGFMSAGRLQSIVGLMADCHATVPLCLFQLRPLSSHLSRNFKWRSDPIKKIIPLDVPEVVEALQFWSDPSRVAKRVPLGYQLTGQTLTTDASSYGWGAVLDGDRCSGRWTPEESKYHVNVLEIMAVLRAIHYFQESLPSRSPSNSEGHTTVQSYLNRGRDQVPVSQLVSP